MWILQNDSFLSIVRHLEKPGHLLVRSRIEGDIERAFARSGYQPEVYEDGSADYRYRADVPKEAVSAALAASVEAIDYPNFKNSIPYADHERKSAYEEVWRVLARRFGAFGK